VILVGVVWRIAPGRHMPVAFAIFHQLGHGVVGGLGGVVERAEPVGSAKPDRAARNWTPRYVGWRVHMPSVTWRAGRTQRLARRSEPRPRSSCFAPVSHHACIVTFAGDKSRWIHRDFAGSCYAPGRERGSALIGIMSASPSGSAWSAQPADGGVAMPSTICQPSMLRCHSLASTSSAAY